MGQIIDGQAISLKLREQVKRGVEDLVREKNIRPGLAVVLVGEDPASQVYVRNKTKACGEAGIVGFQHDLPGDVAPERLLQLIEKLSRDPQVHGILVQMPLPPGLRHLDVQTLIDPAKDVDGLHPLNLGNLATGRPCFRSCTPFGVMKLLEEIGYDPSGRRAVVLGRSNMVGKPMGLMLLEKNATVTFCHSKTADLPGELSRADLVVAAIGSPEFVKGEWIKPGAVVIDVGINRSPSGKLVGDVEFAPALERASWITPVPKGVGPMTIAMLLWNTLQAARTAAA